MAKFLLELGGEEIPSRFLRASEKELERLFAEALDEHGIKYGKIRTISTPRRLALIIDDLSTTQETREETIMGPPARIAWDADGNPAKPLIGFAKTNGIDIGDVFRVITPKGDYLACKKITGGRPVSSILAEIIPSLISSIPFAKSMRWGNNDVTYARPLRWIVSLLDSEIVPFSYGPVASGRETYGHRVHAPGAFQIANASEYENTVSNKCAITLDSENRLQIIRDIGNQLAHEKDGEIIWKAGLLQEVAGLVEHPVPLLGSFAPDYLEIPAQVLLTSMETHQKSFGVRDRNGELLPLFLTVLNLDPVDTDVARRGWERVLRARLEDARFFWREDLKSSFADWLEKLEKVIFIGPLGNMADKSRRLEKLCGWLASQLNPPADIKLAERSGKLAKADLVSGMVGEFDTLQGVMGGIYAEKAGEELEVAQAIGEQYLPAGPGSPLPKSALGSILSIADKADTLAGCFGLGMIPTGMADPNGLRRCALGIIRIMIARNIEIDPAAIFEKALQLYGAISWKLPPAKSLARLLEFFQTRLRHYFLNLGYGTNFVDAVLASGSGNLPDIIARLDALTAFTNRSGYEKALQTLKRVENISKKDKAPEEPWRDDLIREDAEKDLSSSLRVILPALDAKLAQSDYPGALEQLESLGKPVDNFFDNVMVNCEDAELRANRLNMLKAIAARFAKIAQLSFLQV